MGPSAVPQGLSEDVFVPLSWIPSLASGWGLSAIPHPLMWPSQREGTVCQGCRGAVGSQRVLTMGRLSLGVEAA